MRAILTELTQVGGLVDIVRSKAGPNQPIFVDPIATSDGTLVQNRSEADLCRPV